MENVILPLAVKKLTTGEKRERVLQVLELIGLKARAGLFSGELSGGEQERVAIARILVNWPPLILADEPTGSLDTATAASIMALFSVEFGEERTAFAS